MNFLDEMKNLERESIAITRIQLLPYITIQMLFFNGRLYKKHFWYNKNKVRLLLEKNFHFGK